MKKHTKIYMDAYGYDESDFIPCEICKAEAIDIHHIERRGMGGSKTKDVPENLMALCRQCHEAFGDTKTFKDYLRRVHSKVITKHDKNQEKV